MSRLRGIGIGERLGRWRVTAHAPEMPGLVRVRVADDAGRVGDALVLGADATATARAAFAARHQQLQHLDPPHLAGVLDVDVQPSQVVVVRSPTEDATVAQIDAPLDSAQVAAVGRRLFQAVQECGAVRQGCVQPHDIGFDEHGLPVLAPVGAPVASLAREELGFVAPEAFAPDGEVGADAALYGLGAVLYWLATGRAPQGGSRADRPPPVPVQSLRHGLDDDLAEAIGLLMSPEATLRATALPWLQRAAGPERDLRPSARPRRVGEVRYTTTTQSESAGRADDSPGAYVLLPAAAWPSLTSAQRSLAAGRAGVALSVADGLARDGYPLVIEASAGASTARSRASELARSTDLPVVAVAAGGVSPWLPAILALLVAAVPAAGGALAALPGWFLLAVPLILLGVMIAGAGVAVGLALRGGRGQRLAAAESHQRQQSHRRTRGGQGRLDAAWSRAAALRVELAEQDHLPEPAEADLRDALRDLEADLLDTAAGAVAAGKALSKVDAAGLRTRQEALALRAADDAAARAERDRLAATLADLDAVNAQRDRLLAEVRRIDARLDGIAAAMGRAGADDPQGLDALARDSVDRRQAAERARRQREGS